MRARQILPLAILDAAEGGRVEGRTRLMKLVFLAQEESDVPLPVNYEFRPYDYGPFTQPLLADLNELESRGIIQSEGVPIPSGMKYNYRLNQRYRGRLKEEFGNQVRLDDDEWELIVSRAEETVNKFNDIPISRLLEHVYNKYEEYTEKSVI